MNKKRRVKKIKRNIVWVSLFMFFLMGNLVVFANDDDNVDAGLQIAPLRYNWKVKSGDVRVDEIVVHNFSDVAHEIEVSVENFYVSEDSRQANFFVPDEDHELEAYDVTNWISVPGDFTLAPGEARTLTFSVAVPEDQPTSGYYGAIFFKTHSDDAVVSGDDGGSVTLGVNYRVGALVTLAVQGEEDMQINGSLEEFATTKKVFFDDPVEIYARLKSDGNVHYQASGRIEVYKFGKKFATLMIEPEIMYPGKERTFVEDMLFGQFDHGIYSAKLEMRSEDSAVVFDSEIPFFVVIPWKSTLAIVGSTFFVIMVIRIFKKKYKLVKKNDENEK